MGPDIKDQGSFYALRPGSWRSYLNLLHLPYTLWNVSYVAIGWSLAPEAHWSRLGLACLGFFLAVGISAHALDELKGRPLKSGIPAPVLVFLAMASLAGAAALGVYGVMVTTPWLLAFIATGGFFVVSYNLELAGGKFHNIFWFSLAWGAFPTLTGYFVNAESLDLAAATAAGAAFALSAAQRMLSTPSRYLRRRVVAVRGAVEEGRGVQARLTKEGMLRPVERALMGLSVFVTLLAGALLLAKA
ncbi:MAG: hypothetical protein FJ320_07915 [SAR202 cluster bacterium]|nr:hypothetical protein [SAR202 cluster bacterium]